MAQAKITLIGIENYLNPEKSVFDSMVLPEGIDKDVLIGSIILRCQEFELLYSEPNFLTDAINVWSRKNYRTFEKWVKALEIKYDPLYNYDRTEEYEDEHNGSFNSSGQSNNTLTNNLTDTTNDTLTHSEKAYNDPDYVGTTQDQSNGSITRTGTASNALSNSNNGSNAYKNTHKARLFGNIGVTTSQQMLQSELDIARWNLYEHIADLFCNEFCLMVY